MKPQHLYFLIATLPVLVNADHAPDSWWGWFKLSGSALLAGLTAIKALQSNPPSGQVP